MTPVQLPNGTSGPQATTCLFLPKGDAAGEVFLLVHGLNLRPGRMDHLAQLLARWGYGVVRPVLLGHRASDDTSWGLVSLQDWLDDLEAAEKQARRQWPKAKISLMGFSLGAVLGLCWQQRRGAPFHRVVLLAPAFWPGPLRGWLIHHLLLIWRRLGGPLSWGLPSTPPRSWRIHGRTTLAAYQALDQAAAQARTLLEKWLSSQSSQPWLVAWHPRDEVISPRVLEGLFQGVQGVEIFRFPLRGLFSRPFLPRHFCIAPRSTGRRGWTRFQKRLHGWLESGQAQDGKK